MTDSDEAARDLQLMSELHVLRQERDDIIRGVAVDSSSELAKIHEVLRRKLQIAEDSRQYQLANLGLHLELEKKRAWDEYMAGKARLREQVILSHIERRKRFDALKLGGTFGIAAIPQIRRDEYALRNSAWREPNTMGADLVCLSKWSLFLPYPSLLYGARLPFNGMEIQ
jgi:hypothetical protein